MTKEWIPYTYLLIERSTGIKYYGSKYAKGCHPSDLGVTYFTSSEIVEPLFRSHPENFDFEIRKIFDSADPAAARRWEAKFLQKIDAAHRPDWYNRHNGDEKFGGANAGKKFDKLWCQHISESHKILYQSGYIHPSKGKKRLPETGMRVSKSLRKRYKDKTKHPRYGKKVNKDGRRKMSISGEHAWKEKKQNGIIRAWKIPPLARKWILISPAGQEFCIEGNLRLLCEQHGLKETTMRNTLYGQIVTRGNAVGWKLIKGPKIHSTE